MKLRIRQILDDDHPHGPTFVLEQLTWFKWRPVYKDGNHWEVRYCVSNDPTSLEARASHCFGVHPSTIERVDSKPVRTKTAPPSPPDLKPPADACNPHTEEYRPTTSPSPLDRLLNDLY